MSVTDHLQFDETDSTVAISLRVVIPKAMWTGKDMPIRNKCIHSLLEEARIFCDEHKGDVDWEKCKKIIGEA